MQQYRRSGQSGQESRSAGQIRGAALGADAADGDGQSRRAAESRGSKVRQACSEGTTQINVWEVWIETCRQRPVPGGVGQVDDVLAALLSLCVGFPVSDL